MEAIHVLGRVYFQHNGSLVNMGRRGALHENAMDRGIRIQSPDDLKQFLLGGIRREDDFPGMHAQFSAFLHLGIDIYLGSGVIPHQDYGQARRNPGRLEPVNVSLNLFQNLGGH